MCQNDLECSESYSTANVSTFTGFLCFAIHAFNYFLCAHLVLISETTKEVKKEEDDDAVSSHEEGKVPAFTVLLHGSLKVEGMVALTKVG